jgi:hypothetical protein
LPGKGKRYAGRVGPGLVVSAAAHPTDPWLGRQPAALALKIAGISW